MLGLVDLTYSIPMLKRVILALSNLSNTFVFKKHMEQKYSVDPRTYAGLPGHPGHTQVEHHAEYVEQAPEEHALHPAESKACLVKQWIQKIPTWSGARRGRAIAGGICPAWPPCLSSRRPARPPCPLFAVPPGSRPPPQ